MRSPNPQSIGALGGLTVSARDVFNVPLKCPNCGKSGTARFSEADGYAYLNGDRETSVSHLPEGFKVVNEQGPYGSVRVHCADCDLAAEVYPKG